MKELLLQYICDKIQYLNSISESEALRYCDQYANYTLKQLDELDEALYQDVVIKMHRRSIIESVIVCYN